MNGRNVIADRYEVISHIGQGGMADVFLAIDTILNRQVAIKIMRADMSGDAVSILRFEREAQAAAALAHPNIVEIYDVGEYKGHHYIVMEYVVGQTLKHMIRARGRLLTQEAIDILQQLCSALAEAHSRGIIHRDIKPQNVIIKADGTAKILDFGIATAKGAIQLTQANNVMGSVHYLAPELAKGDPASPQSDIYALGIVLFEMLAGDVPFKADQAVQVAMKHIREPMPDIRQINPDVPQSVANIITRATAKLPQQRYHSCDEMLADAATCLNPRRLNEKPLVIPMPGQTPASRQEKSKPVVLETGPDVHLEGTPEKQPVRKKKHTGLWIVLIVLLAAAVFLGAMYAGFLPFTFFPSTVPSLVGMTVDEAQNTCDQEKISLDTAGISYALSETEDAGVILDQSPEPGSRIQADEKIEITVSSGIGAEGENYIGQNIDRVTSSLKNEYPSLSITAEPVDSANAPGTILSQDGIEEGVLFDPSSASVTFTYSAYVTVTIPEDIVGKTVSDAQSELESMGIEVHRNTIDTSTMSQEERDRIQDQFGIVIYSDPAAGTSFTQKEGRYVTLYSY